MAASHPKPSLTGLVTRPQLHAMVDAWLREDIPSFDCGGMVVGDKEETAELLCKSSCVLAGVPFATAVFHRLECSVEWLVVEGTDVTPITVVARVSGRARDVLSAERLALNILARASGIATQARAMRRIADEHGWHGEVCGTRKTTPGFRMVEKYALLVGGAGMHRMDLSSMIMLKDNHIWSLGGIEPAVRAARAVGGFSLKIEVECQNLEEALQAARSGADVCMLDNMAPELLHESAGALKAAHPHVLVEASGGITHTTLHRFFSPHVDVVSMGSLTQGYGTADFSLKVSHGWRKRAAERGGLAAAAAAATPARAARAASEQ